MHESPCPICGESIHLHRGARLEFDCVNACRSRDIDAWTAARAEQLAAEVQAWLEHRGLGSDTS